MSLKNISNFNISYSRVWFLAWPIILANTTIPLIGATNVAVVGRLDSPIYIGAVALGVLVLQCIYWSFAFLRKATTGTGKDNNFASASQGIHCNTCLTRKVKRSYRKA